MNAHTTIQAPAVSVIVPCRNEAGHIEHALETILHQQVPRGGFEVLVADGMSTDQTRSILKRFAEQHANLRVIDNPAQFVSPGLNLAIRAARGEIIVRMDLHTEYAPDYLVECVSTLLTTKADNVGGPARTRSNGYLQGAICTAYHSPFSCGGAAFHDIRYEGYVDTVTYGCWKKCTLERLGLFDEELVRNQDDELNLRLARSGGKIWQAPGIRSWYYPRASLAALFRQYAQYGYWKVRVIQKHRLPASWRHLVPGLFVAAAGASLTLAPFSRLFRLMFLLIVGTYLLANLLAAILTCSRSPNRKYLPIIPLIFACYHLGYGYGFLRGLLDFWVLRRTGSAGFTRLTRSQTAG
jgi:succinoglycan biosynthesis protein ExoA